MLRISAAQGAAIILLVSYLPVKRRERLARDIFAIITTHFGLICGVTNTDFVLQKYRKVKSGIGSPDWNVSMVEIHPRNLLWAHRPGHAGAKGNDRADRLAGKPSRASDLLLERPEVLRSLRHYLRVQSQGHHTIDRLQERGVERGSARRSSLKGRERAIVNQTNVGTVSKATLGKLLRDGVERIWVFPIAQIPPGTELN